MSVNNRISSKIAELDSFIEKFKFELQNPASKAREVQLTAYLKRLQLEVAFLHELYSELEISNVGTINGDDEYAEDIAVGQDEYEEEDEEDEDNDSGY